MLELIDPNAGYPSVQYSKWIQKYAPKCWELFFGKKYILPNYRTTHYVRQDFVNFMEWATLVALPFTQDRTRDEIMNASFCNTAGSLYHGRPTLFLERELGEALLRAPLPVDMVSDDIKWRWPAMRIYLPVNLIPLEHNTRKYSIMFLDIGLLEANEGRSIPPDLAKEIDLFSTKLNSGEKPAYLSFQKFQFFYPDRAIVISGFLNAIDGLDMTDLTTYAMVKPFKQYTIAQIQAMTDRLKSAWACDKADDAVTKKMEHLAIQTLLFLSAFPLEYQPEKTLRRPSMAGQRHISGLYAARFVGASQIRPERVGDHHIASAEGVIGYHLPHHWRGGHWKRQPFGPKSGQRKLIWINTYEAGLLEEEEKT